MSSSSIPETLKAKIRTQADNRCGYCLSLQMYVLKLLEVEHIIPKAKGGSDDEDNLWLACRLCNNYKGTQTDAIDPVRSKKVKLFNPRKQKWSKHFEWSEDGTQIVGTTACSRATVIALQLNNIISVTVRQQWVLAGWHPPKSD
ncbi:MAG: HNH endonuclease signature motif containing protein [Nostocaceae cyanobacterium]|nr:HNH endonuclease signature motif containing protein [Nostocaceae cyanobacterium]